MAKGRNRKAGPGARAVERAAISEETVAAVAPAVPILRVPVGGSITVEVDVTNPSNDYTVQLGDTTLMFARVDRKESARNLQAGRFFLTWHFVHSNKGWEHSIKATSSGGGPPIEEHRSEANKDAPRSTGIALAVVS
jgi:hypothetical protein